MSDAVLEAIVPAEVLDEESTVAEALARMEQSGAAFVVLRNRQGGLRGPIAVEALRQANGDIRLEEVGKEAPPPVIIPPEMGMDQIARIVAKDLVLNPRIQGVIVRGENQISGILPRRSLAQRAARLVMRGTADRMEGAPVDILYFECPVDGERQIVPYYDPQNPPTCSQGHRMEPVED